MKTIYTILLLTFITNLSAAPQNEPNTETDWSRVKQEARENKAPVPSPQNYDEMTKRDQYSTKYNSGGNRPYQDISNSYDYSEIPSTSGQSQTNRVYKHSDQYE